jgi:hypothetical protein
MKTLFGTTRLTPVAANIVTQMVDAVVNAPHCSDRWDSTARPRGPAAPEHAEAADRLQRAECWLKGISANTAHS